MTQVTSALMESTSAGDEREVLVRVEGVSKKFCRSLKKSLWYGVQDIGSELVGRRYEHELRPDEFWSVTDVSFELRRGECLGLIGPNGAGKSTLLKMLNGLIKPDKGRIEMNGRVGALIELGTGFNPVLTGRENIYNNAAVLGLTKAETDEKLEAIIEFAEIDEFLDMPVQNYSSGMKVRLGFAVAAHLKPDILIIDEVLAVGDVGFRAKCYTAISRIQKKTAIIFVSHSTPQIGRLAQRVLVLNKGRKHFYGDTPGGTLEYQKMFSNSTSETLRAGTGEAQFLSIDFLNILGKNSRTFMYGDQLTISMKIESSINIENLVVDFVFYTISEEVVAECNNYVRPFKLNLKKGESKSVNVKISELTLNPGIYKISALLTSENMLEHFDWLEKTIEIEVLGKSAIAGQQFIGCWSIDF